MQRIFLIGLSGSGKSTIGRLLAHRLGLPLLDIDALIEAECSERISTIFTRHGEEYFRNCESSILAKVTQRSEPAIIATGGGIVVRQENRLLMAERGLRIFLSVDPQTALKRLQSQQDQALRSGIAPEIRPLLSSADPLMALQVLSAARTSWYAEADYTYSTQGKSVETIIQEILSMLICSGEFNGMQHGIAPIIRRVHIGDGYDAVVDWGGIGRLAQYLTQLHLPERVFLVTDSNVHALYGQILQKSLSQAGFEPQLHVVPAGETSKSQQQLNALYDWLLDQHAERREAMVALGGGVVNDLVGYTAATYLRGVPLIQVPTSLLAQVDAAIGGKTGINHPKGKNLIGSFYHPRLVLVDPTTLLTLPAREYIEGWAEIVKYGIILDAALFELLEEHANILRTLVQPPVALLCQILARCIDLKVTVIEGDEREQGRRAILNYGHTVGHALENVAGYGQWLHGEAVSLGMVVAATLAKEAGMFSAHDEERQSRLLSAFGLPTVYSGSVQGRDILTAMQRDKKVAEKRVRWVVPRRIGEVTMEALPDELVQRVVSAFFA